LGYSDTGNVLINVATSYAVFHFANWPNLFYPCQTGVVIIFKNNFPVAGAKTIAQPLIGFVVKLP